MQKGKKPVDKISIGMIVGGIIGVIGGVGCVIFAIFGLNKVMNESTFPQVGVVENSDNSQKLSVLTGLELADGARKDGPIYCMQTPNGLDGARPQVGMTEAGVVFEAIAEAGITRFAAIYQEPSSGALGPIRSLRMYYLDWDTPFDCTIVHAGGADDALAAVRNGSYSDLDENYDYMFRGTYGARAWNNLFTTGALLAKFTEGESSQAKGFARMTPEESTKARVDSGAIDMLVITEPSEGDTSSVEAEVPEVAIDFGGSADFNVNYQYDSESNTYLRSYATGQPHRVYECPAGNASLQDPEAFCSLTQLAPSVVVAMVVKESRAADNYHENITTTGTGTAYIFQNGTAIEGSWSKATVADQIKFFDENGDELKLAVGQTFIEAVPSYGSVEY